VNRFLPGVHQLRCHVQHYDWGDAHAIPALTGKPNPNLQPWAELWMGAHPDMPSEIKVDDAWVSLGKIITEHPTLVLGHRVQNTFEGALPFLFKLLAAAQPLSIQVHPSKSAAESGFLKENEQNIPLSAVHRNYKDQNHKPEIITALTPFYGLRGFRPLEDMRAKLSSVPEFSDFLNDLDGTPDAIPSLYERMMNLDADKAHALLDPLIQRLRVQHAEQPFPKETLEYWVLRSDQVYFHKSRHDRGLFSFYLLNLVVLQPGQAMYLPAGVLHAYLEGVGMELMANSNNVLRGGLTPKHVDVDELLNHVSFQSEKVEILSATPVPGSDGVKNFETSAEEFELQRLSSEDRAVEIKLLSKGPEILFPSRLNSNAVHKIRDASGDIELQQGSPLLICHGLEYTLSLAPGAEVFRALVPLPI
jgi:mannose-6-phosphate isomerase